jgi:hypothetical protein
MSKTNLTAGLSKPHKGQAAIKGIGGSMSNAKSINTERSPKNSVGCGIAKTYFGNSRAIGSTDRKGK